MTEIKTSPYSRMTSAIAGLLKANAAIREGIAEHAERHESTLDARRKSADNEAKINEGIARQSG